MNIPVEAEDWQGLIADPEVPGEKLCVLAGRPDIPVDAVARLAADEARLKATPAIAAAIYGNRAVPLSVANLAIVTCQRVGVVPDAIAGFEELAAAILADPAALNSTLVDAEFAGLLDDSPETDAAAQPLPSALLPSVGAGVAAEVSVQTSADADKAGGNKSRGRRSAVIDFTRLKLYEKIRLATLGNAYCRQNLLRDSNRMVAMAVIRSPQMTDSEMAKAAGNRALSEEVIRYIGNRKELVKQYPVKLALVGNAKCPLAVALRLLPTLNADDIKQIARSKNVPGALAVAAKRLAAAKGPQ